jgi:hypothetical protein
MPYIENYNTDPEVAQEGQVADTSPATILSRTVDAEIGFGKAVQKGAKQHSVKAAVDRVDGITVRSQATGARASSPDVYPANDTAAIITKGPIWVKVDSTVVEGDDVTLTVATGLFGTKAVAAGVIAVAGAVFDTGAAANGLARIRINLPQ